MCGTTRWPPYRIYYRNYLSGTNYLYRNYLHRNYLYRNYLYRNYLYVKRGLWPA